MIYAVGMSMLAVGGVMMGYHAFKLAELFDQAAVETLSNPFEADIEADLTYGQVDERGLRDDLVRAF